MKKVSLFLTLLVMGTFSAQAATRANCPNLDGSYSCPAFGGQPAYTLTVTHTDNGSGTRTYHMYYSYIGQTFDFTASDQGYSSGGYTDKCMLYQYSSAPNSKKVKAFSDYPNGGDPIEDGSMNYLLSTGYRVDFNGSNAIFCPNVQ